MQRILTNAAYALVLTPVVLMALPTGFAQVMQSGSYRIQSDSINFGGGLSTSSSYTLESTAGEIATGESESDSYALRSGYQQMQEVYISISGFGAVTMTPSIPGVSGGFANGSTTVLVVTDSSSGYALSISSTENPALRSGVNTIADYVPVSTPPDFTFVTDATDAHLGYTPEGIDIVSRFRDDTGACAVGSADTSLACWDGLSTTLETIASRTTANHPLGSTTTINFRVGVGGSVLQPTGTYTATTTLTALPL